MDLKKEKKKNQLPSIWETFVIHYDQIWIKSSASIIPTNTIILNIVSHDLKNKLCY